MIVNVNIRLPSLLIILLCASSAFANSWQEAANTVAASFKGSSAIQRMLIAEPSGADENISKTFNEALVAAFVAADIPIIDRSALEAALREISTAQALGDSDMSEIAGAMGADGLVTTELQAIEGGYAVYARLIDVASGEVTISAKTQYFDAGNITEEAQDLETQIRRLSDRIATGLDLIEGDIRYQRFAVLSFDESGELTKDKKLGRLIASEITTVLNRDHGLFLVERSQLDKVVGELALGQSGVLDESTSIQVGQMSGAEALVIGTVSEAGDQYLVNAKVVSTEKGEVVLAEQTEFRAQDLVAMSDEAVALRSKTGAFYRSLLLPGWGQVYNRQPVKAAIFAGVEGAALASAITFHVLGVVENDRYNQLPAGSNFEAQIEKVEQQYLFRNILIGVTLGIHVAQVLDAVISGYSPPKNK